MCVCEVLLLLAAVTTDTRLVVETLFVFVCVGAGGGRGGGYGCWERIVPVSGCVQAAV